MHDTSPPGCSQDRAIGQIPSRDPKLLARQPVCIVLHQENSNPGHVGQWFVRNGYRLDIRKPRFGDRLPATLEQHCGAVIFGGPMSANDKDEFVRAEIDWIEVALREKKPLLGICLGAQMLTANLGGKVEFHPDDAVEIGYYPLSTTAAAKTLGPFPDQCLRVAQGRLRAAAGGALAGDLAGRLSQPGLPLWAGRRGRAVSSRDHLCSGASLDGPQPRAPHPEGRVSAAVAHRRPRLTCTQGAGLARSLS